MTNNHKDKPVEIDAKQIKVDDKVAELSIQKRAESQGALMAGNFADTMWFVRQYDDALVAPWWSEQRDADLRGFVLQDGNDILQGAISSMIKKIKALPWFLEGPQRVVKRYQEPLANADFGGGWGVFLGKLLYDYLTQDKGGFTEFIGDGKPDGPITGPVLGLAHLDAGLCQLTGDPIYPVLYRNPKTGKPNKLHATRVGHIVDTPSPNETMNNVGFCSTSRTIASSRILLKLAQYKNEKLDDLPEAGLLLFNNLMPSKWEDARKNHQRGRRRIGQELWSPIMTLFGIDPAQPVTAQLISFANLPENFDELTSTNIYVNIVALAFGVDVREFWPMSQGSLGTATESTVMAAKAKGKGPGDIISSVERLINWYMLPESVTFRFDVQDDDEDKLRADINKTRTDTIMSMWKPPDAGQLAAGVVAPVTPVEIRQMLADNVPYFNKDFLEVDLTDEVTVSDTDQEEADDDKAFGRRVRIDHKGYLTVPRKVKRMTEAGKVLAQAEQNFRDGKISLDDLIEFRLGAVLDSQDFFNKAFYGHAGRPGKRGGSMPANTALSRTTGKDRLARQAAAKGIREVQAHGLRTGNEALVGYDIEGNKIDGTSHGGKDYAKIDNVITPQTYVFVHNHPSSSSFSGEDIDIFGKSNANHMVVVGHDGTIYKLSKPDGWISYSELDPHYYSLSFKSEQFMTNSKYAPRVLEKGENANLVWREQSHEIVHNLARSTGLIYERILPK